MDKVFDIARDWNFLFPLVLWMCREIIAIGFKWKKRTFLFGIRSKKKDIYIVQDQETAYQGHLSGAVGSIAVARASQKLRDDLKATGLSVKDIDSKEFDPGVTGRNYAIVGTFHSKDSVASRVVNLLGHKLEVGGNHVILDGKKIGPQLALRAGSLELIQDQAIVLKSKNPNDESCDIILVASVTGNGIEQALEAFDRKDTYASLTEKRYGIFLVQVTMDSKLLKVTEILEEK